MFLASPRRPRAGSSTKLRLFKKGEKAFDRRATLPRSAPPTSRIVNGSPLPSRLCHRPYLTRAIEFFCPPSASSPDLLPPSWRARALPVLLLPCSTPPPPSPPVPRARARARARALWLARARLVVIIVCSRRTGGGHAFRAQGSGGASAVRPPLAAINRSSPSPSRSAATPPERGLENASPTGGAANNLVSSSSSSPSRSLVMPPSPKGPRIASPPAPSFADGDDDDRPYPANGSVLEVDIFTPDDDDEEEEEDDGAVRDDDDEEEEEDDGAVRAVAAADGGHYVPAWDREERYSNYEDLQRRSTVNCGGGKPGESIDVKVNHIPGQLKVNGSGIWKLHGPAADYQLNVDPSANRVGFRFVEAGSIPGVRDFRELEESTKIEDTETHETWYVKTDEDSEMFIILPKYGVSPAAACAAIGSHLRVGFEDVPASRGHGNFVKWHLDSSNLEFANGVAHEIVTACSNLPSSSNVHVNEHGMPGFEGGDKGSTAHADTIFTNTKTGKPNKVRMLSHTS